MTGDGLPDPRQMFLVSDRGMAAHAAQIAAARDVPPDVWIEVGHRHCGDLTCVRPDGPVGAVVTWLDGADDGLEFKVVIDGAGFPACRQTVVRLQREVDRLLRERGAGR